MKKILIILCRAAALLVLVVLFAVFVTGFSPIYRFAQQEAFNGPDIFNPYRNFVPLLESAPESCPAPNATAAGTPAPNAPAQNATAAGVHAPVSSPNPNAPAPEYQSLWKRANFHTHTRVDGIFNECSHTPAETADSLKGFGYDIITFSNHNALTEIPADVHPRVNVYEHGWNLLKFHKLVFGVTRVLPWDNLLPVLASQRQFQLDLLGKESDLLQLNHPSRTGMTLQSTMQKLDGYDLIELDSGKTTEQLYWDWALSAGHYSFGLANDDLHYPDRSRRIAVRCNFLQIDSCSYPAVRQCLQEGCFYSMRVPDYGRGDWKVKHERNLYLPYIKNIGLRGEEIFISLSSCADSIRVTGQDGSRLAFGRGCDSLSYCLRENDSYARFTAWFPDGEVIYSNPFARYDASASCCEDASSSLPGTSRSTPSHHISIILTILYNLLILSICSLIVLAACRCLGIRTKRRS